jgi:hypothetical protein
MGLRTGAVEGAVSGAEENISGAADGQAAAAAEGGAAQGQSGSESKEGTLPPGQEPAVDDKAVKSDEEQEEGDKETPAKAAYKAREKFKVMDSEHEVPAFLKSLIKDEASEKQVIELLEKAYGLEPTKTRLVDARKERDTFKQELSTVTRSISDLRQIYQRGDIDAFLDKLAIPQERMLQWALEKVNYSQLPPEQQRVLDERRDAQRKAWAAEQQNQELSTSGQELARQARIELLEAGLASPDVKTFADTFDSLAGKPGSFKRAVQEEGLLAYQLSEGKEDLTPKQAIERAMTKLRPFVTAAKAQAPAPQGIAAAGAGAPAPQPNAKPSVIPNLQGRPQTALKSKPQNLEQLRKLRDAAMRE